MIVEVRHKNFEFYRRGKPTGHYVRGHYHDDLPEEGMIEIESLFDGKKHLVDVEYITIID